MNEAVVRKLLSLADHPLRVRVDARHIEALVRAYLAWPRAYRPAFDAREPPEAGEGRALYRFLCEQAGDLLGRIQGLECTRQDFQRRFETSAHPQEKADLAIDMARELGATPAQLRGDRRALRRHLDLAAVMDRCLDQRAAHEQRLSIILRRLGHLAEWLLQQEDSSPHKTWHELDLETHLHPLLFYPGDERVRLEALRALLGPLAVLPDALAASRLSDQTVRLLFRSAVGHEEPVWIQRECLSGLAGLDPDAFSKALHLRLEAPGPGDDLFVRCQAVALLARHMHKVEEGPALLERAALDPSPRVRQRLAETAHLAWDEGGHRVLARLAQQDPEPAVRAAAILGLREVCADENSSSLGQDLLRSVLAREPDAFVVRTALHALELLGDAIGPERIAGLCERFLPILENLHVSHPSLSVRRWSAQTREYLWCCSHPPAREALNHILALRDQIPEGGHRAATILEGCPEPILGRALSVAARRDFGLSLGKLHGHLHLHRGERFGFRLWRFLHELRTPDPAKRQGCSHLVGRHFRGRLRAPSAILGELAETKVPGEPLYHAHESGWRPYLPLLDEAVSLVEPGAGQGPLRIYTSEGITELHPPRGFGKWRARIGLATGFTRLASARNWKEGEASDPSEYLRNLESLGFQCSHRPYGPGEGLPTSADPAVLKFFPALAVPPLWVEQFRNLQDYFHSAYGNTLTDLLFFTLGTGAFFVGRNVVRHQRMRYHRRRLPLVIGGWGTRGKSGTERLKAALFSALGYGVVSKTTGCESMFLYGKPFQSLKEMYLFRPYDKVSIQEQTFVVRMASRLNTDVFLWECMALSPHLVQLLQDQWMKDDLSTLTNAFPDHEDVQGPAGHDIPRVMTHFVPGRRTLYTSEENMLPILADAARRKGTRIRQAAWLESGLITGDVLARFPYQEHPDNIALVVALAGDLGVDPDFALKEMADRVVADLGVLRTFPDARIRGRRLRFTNGMSANEPFGALGNWKRVGFAGHDPDASPGTWITAVVNNRADRVARSRVFAQLIAEQLEADRFFLIGTNLTGMRGYLREACHKAMDRLSLDPDLAGDRSRACEILLQSARAARIPATADQLVQRVEAMIVGLGIPLPPDTTVLATSQGLADHLRKMGQEAWIAEMEPQRAAWAAGLEEFQALRQRIIEDPGPPSSLDAPFRELVEQWFERKFQVVEDPFATGEQIVDILATATPPGYRNLCMGIQNIKGTGLDFVYRFLDWGTCHAGCQRLLDPDVDIARAAVKEFQVSRPFGLLSEETVRETLEHAKTLPAFRAAPHQVELERLRRTFETRLEEVRLGMTRNEAPGWKDRILSVLESLLDTQDSIRRSRQARGIYRDLLKGRISRERSVEELRRLTHRQYGGWLRGRA